MAAIHLKDLIKAQQQQQAAKNANQERMSIAEFRKLMGLTADNTKKQVEVLNNIETLTVQTSTAQKEQVEDTKSLIEKDVETHTRLDAIKETLEKSLTESKNQTKTLEKLDKESERQKDSVEQTVEAERARDEQLRLLKKIADGVRDDKGKDDEKPAFKGPGLGGMLTGLAVALGTIVGSIKLYATAIVKMNKFVFGAIEKSIVYVGKFFPKLKTLLFNIETTFVLGMDMIKEGFGNFIQKALRVFDNVKDFMGGILSKVMNTSFMKSIVEMFTKIVRGVKSFFEPIQDAFKVLEETASPISKAIGFIKTKFSAFAKFFDFISDQLALFGKIFGAVSKIASKLAVPITIIMTVWDVVKGIVEGFEKEGIVGAISGAIKGLISSLITAPVDLIKDAISWILDVFGFDKASKLLDSFSLDDLMKSFVDAIFHPIDTIRSMFEGVASFFEGIEIPEISFTIPIIDKKVSIGPFRPFGKSKDQKSSQPASSSASPEKGTSAGATKAVPSAPVNAANPSGVGAKTQVSSTEAKAVLENGSKKDIDALGGKEKLQKVAKGEITSTGSAVTPSASTAAKESPASKEIQPTAVKALTGKQERELLEKDPALYDKLKNYEDDLIDAGLEKIRKDPELQAADKETRRSAFEVVKKNAATDSVSKFSKELESAGILAPQTAEIQTPKPTEANQVYGKSAENAQQAVQNQGQTSAPVVISAPVTNNVKQNQNIAMPAPIRNTDSGFNRYVQKNSVMI